MLLLNVLMAAAWMALTGDFSPLNFIFGFAASYFILWFVWRAVGPSRYFAKIPQVIGFIGFYLWELIISSLRVAYIVLSPAALRPGVIAVPLDIKTDAEIALLTNVITLTPGTLSLDVASDRSTLYVHAIEAPEPNEFCREIKQNFERRVRELLA
jgi:multicomponent Na+:H+ antiporter subunit E